MTQRLAHAQAPDSNRGHSKSRKQCPVELYVHRKECHGGVWGLKRQSGGYYELQVMGMMEGFFWVWNGRFRDFFDWKIWQVLSWAAWFKKGFWGYFKKRHLLSRPFSSVNKVKTKLFFGVTSVVRMTITDAEKITWDGIIASWVIRARWRKIQRFVLEFKAS